MDRSGKTKVETRQECTRQSDIGVVPVKAPNKDRNAGVQEVQTGGKVRGGAGGKAGDQEETFTNAHDRHTVAGENVERTGKDTCSRGSSARQNSR